MSSSKFQKGFTLVEGLLVVLVLTIMVGVGYYVFSSMNKDKDDATASSSSSTSTQSNTQKNASTKYLEIKELGVKVPLTSKISDAEYAMAPDGETAGISTKEFRNAVSDCKAADTASSSYASITLVNKYNGTYDSNNPPFNAYSEFSTQLDGFYLMTGSVDGGYCNGSDSAKSQAVKDLFNELSPLIKDAVANAKKS